jgi:hypothetical protein
MFAATPDRDRDRRDRGIAFPRPAARSDGCRGHNVAAIN